MSPIQVHILSVKSLRSAGQDETRADVNTASCGASDIRGRWLKEPPHQSVCTHCDDVSPLTLSTSSCASNLLCARSSRHDHFIHN